MEQGQENADCFLFVPGEDHAQWEFVYAAVEGFGKCNSYFDGAVGIVALAHVHDSRESADGSEVEVVKSVFSAGFLRRRSLLPGRSGGCLRT